MANEYMSVKNVKKDHFRFFEAIELRPIELQMKEDGCMNDEPSFCLVMQSFMGKVVAQFSFNTIADCFDQLGYSLTKKLNSDKEVQECDATGAK